MRGLDVGTDQISQATGSALEGIGGLLGLEGLEQYGAEVALENEADIQRKSRFSKRWDDVEDISSFGSYFGETQYKNPYMPDARTYFAVPLKSFIAFTIKLLFL